MEKVLMKNSIKVLYQYRAGNITSFCIGFNAGALEEQGYNLGVAHAVEHMVFKGTTNRNENEINILNDELFGFSNAMTNFPYSIYYGTTNTEDFAKALNLYGDIVMNAKFSELGFEEERGVILEELKDWKEDLSQYCEDMLLFNSFDVRRIKHLIIGTEDSVKAITLEELKAFYKEFYSPKNCVISVVTSLSLSDVLSILEEEMGEWEKTFAGIKRELYERNKEGIFYKKMPHMEGAKIQYGFNIDTLNEKEIPYLELFNLWFGDGVSSILYDELRTKRGLCYEIASNIKNERGIKLFSIFMSTSKVNIEEAIKIINNQIKAIKEKDENFYKNNMDKLIKRYSLKQELALERSIEICKKLTTYELMYDCAEKVFNDIKFYEDIDYSKFCSIINKVLNKPAIQVLY
jgi:predicted Zn-dependent peptidase